MIHPSTPSDTWTYSTNTIDASIVHLAPCRQIEHHKGTLVVLTYYKKNGIFLYFYEVGADHWEISIYKPRELQQLDAVSIKTQVEHSSNLHPI